jgi:hypothetical protein
MSSKSRILVDLAAECFSHNRRVSNSLFESLVNDFYSSSEEVEIIALQTIAMSLGAKLSSEAFWKLLEMTLRSSMESVRANACCIIADYEKWHSNTFTASESSRLGNYKLQLLADKSDIVKNNAAVKFNSTQI